MVTHTWHWMSLLRPGGCHETVQTPSSMPYPLGHMLPHTATHSIVSYYKSSSVCLFVCLSVCSLSPPRSFDRSSPNLVGVCRWTSELPLRGSFSKRSTARRVNGSLSLSTILYMCQPHSTQLQKATLLLLHLIRLKGTFCCIDGWWVYVGGSRNWLLDGSSMACLMNLLTGYDCLWTVTTGIMADLKIATAWILLHVLHICSDWWSNSQGIIEAWQ